MTRALPPLPAGYRWEIVDGTFIWKYYVYSQPMGFVASTNNPASWWFSNVTARRLAAKTRRAARNFAFASRYRA